MKHRWFRDLDYVARRLAQHLDEAANDTQAPQVVFLLGAGCSKQYGLPSFSDLLGYIYEGFWGRQPDTEGYSFEALRAELDPHWQNLGPGERRKLLTKLLTGTRGEFCPGYLRLADLCRGSKGQQESAVTTPGPPEEPTHGKLQRPAVKAVINMNFDCLFEQALAKKGVDFKVFTSFKSAESSGETLAVIKPHGTLRIPQDEITTLSGRDGALPGFDPYSNLQTNELILDIAKGDLFLAPGEQEAAHLLLAQSHVVCMGYSGVDAKVASSLGPSKPRPGSSGGAAQVPGSPPPGGEPLENADYKLYFINLFDPDARLFPAISARESQALVLKGDDGCFDCFMERLAQYQGLRGSRHALEPAVPLASDQFFALPNTFMARSEREALSHCVRLALRIRAGISVADRSPKSIEQHASEVYHLCLQIARAARLSLTPPEKFLLYATALFHDLGYFAAYAEGSAIGHGWKLLTEEHGLRTEKLLRAALGAEEGGETRFNTELTRQLVPQTYFQNAPATGTEVATETEVNSRQGKFLNLILWLVARHSLWDLSGEAELARVSELRQVSIAGHDIPVDPLLLQALFAAAEELAQGHPFRPSVDPVLNSSDDQFSVQDPILDFYLRRAQHEVSCSLEGDRVVIKARRESASFEVLATLAENFIHQLNAGLGQVKDRRCRRLSVERRLEVGSSSPRGVKISRGDLRDKLVPKALSEILASSLTEVERDFARELASRLERDLQVNLAANAQHSSRPFSEEVRELATAYLRALPTLRAGTGAGSREFGSSGQGEGACEGVVAVLEQVLREHGQGLDGHSLQTQEQVAKGPALEGLLPFLGAGEVTSILDLLTAYTQRAFEGEPRVAMNDPVVVRVLDLLRPRLAGQGSQIRAIPHEGLLGAFFEPAPAEGSALGSGLNAWLRISFNHIVYPAWRFLAQNWHDDMEPLLMARACLDLGSSRFRAEVLGGVQSLLEHKLKRDEADHPGRAFGHSGCTVCSSRLLYVFSYARRLFPAHEQGRLRDSDGRGLNDAVAGLLRFFLERPAKSKAWMGLGLGQQQEKGIYSAEYLAWSVRAVAFYATVREEVAARTGEAWPPEIQEQEVLRLLGERAQALLSLTAKDLLGSKAEEPHSFILGHVALAYRHVAALRKRCQMLGEKLYPGETWKPASSAFGVEFRRAYHELLGGCSPEVWLERVESSAASGTAQAARKGRRNSGSGEQQANGTGWRSLSLLDRLYLWPAQVLDFELAVEAVDTQQTLAAQMRTPIGTGADLLAQKQGALVALLRECVDCPVWVARGEPDGGSWGYNIKNTQTVVTSLVSFLRHAWEDPVIRQGYDRFLREEDLPNRFKELLHPGDPAASGPGKPS